MILYDPVRGDPFTNPVTLRPRTCFLMTKLGEQVPVTVTEVRERISAILAQNRFEVLDANSATTGKDFLLKIWELIVSVPIGVAIVYKGMPKNTVGNVYYEIGLMHALGKETLVVKTEGATIPSDFMRTEYVAYDKSFDTRFQAFVRSLTERAEYFNVVADQMERNPLLAIDYYRRAYLLTGDRVPRTSATAVWNGARWEGRAKNSVERLLASFLREDPPLLARS